MSQNGTVAANMHLGGKWKPHPHPLQRSRPNVRANWIGSLLLHLSCLRVWISGLSINSPDDGFEFPP